MFAIKVCLWIGSLWLLGAQILYTNPNTNLCLNISTSILLAVQSLESQLTSHIVTGFLECHFSGRKSLWLVASLPKFCSGQLGLFHPLVLAGCAQLMLPAWVPLLPRASQALAGEGCVSEHGVWPMCPVRHAGCYSRAGNSRCWHRCRLSVRPDQVHCKQLSQLALGNTWCSEAWRCQQPLGLQGESHSSGSGNSQVWAPRRAAALLSFSSPTTW